MTNIIAKPVKRRTFIKQAGGGITVLFTIGLPSVRAQRSREYPDDFNAYLRIHENGRVSCYTGKIEMGQGIFTSLAQMLADELEISLDKVDMVMGDTFLCPYDGGTVGSRSTKYFGPPLRKAAAEAKQVLLQLAAEKLGLPAKKLTTREGTIFSSSNPAKSVTYAELARGQKIERHLKNIDPEPRNEHTLCGKPTRRTDSIAKVTGEAKFAGDIRLPGMLYAKVLKAPSHGAELQEVDLTGAKTIPGTIVVNEPGLVAVLHEKPDMAEKAVSLIKAQFGEKNIPLNNQNSFTHLQTAARSTRPVVERGDTEGGRAASAIKKAADYFNHYVAHAPMETHTILVHIQGDEVTVWSATQTPFRVQSMVAETLGVDTDKVHVITPFVGGGFGGKKTGRLVSDAARLAQITGRPVQISWSREEEFFYDTFRPAAVIKADCGVDKEGRITYWDFAHLFSGTRSSEPPYNIPNLKVLSAGGSRDGGSPHPFETGAWRGPGSNTNVFAMESHVDVMAAAAGIDPLSFRLKNLTDQRMIRVVEAAAERFGHTFQKGPSGNGYGIAITNYLNTYVATMAEVEVNKQSGQVQVKRIVCAQDMGEIINPQGATLQIEGGLTMGLGYCLTEEIRFEGGRILTENFDTYEIPRFSWLPDIEVVLVDNPDLPPQGCGEPAITTTGAVLANAVYDAIGVRLYTLPMSQERIIQSLQKNQEN